MEQRVMLEETGVGAHSVSLTKKKKKSADWPQQFGTKYRTRYIRTINLNLSAYQNKDA